MRHLVLPRLKSVAIGLAVALCLRPHALPASDWPQFLGPRAAAQVDDRQVPSVWSETENLRWKTRLPGAGSSSPIVVGNQVFVTCYTGYGVPKAAGAEPSALQRALVSVARQTGKIEWSQTIPAELPEDGYQGFITEHGYASSTPASDGERVYCFVGKSGVIAFDLTGKQLWRTAVGRESSSRRWGSAASPIVFKNLVIVNASEESQSIRALDALTGREVWQAAGAALELSYGTPSLVSLPSGEAEVVVAMPSELWGLNPETGKLRWHMEHLLTGNVSPSVVVDGERLFVFGGFRSAGSFGFRAGGRGEVTRSHLLWSSRNSSYVATPVLYGDHLYWVDDRGQAYCSSAKTGELVYRERITGLASGGRPVYASPICVHDKLYVPTRWNGTLVLPAAPKFEILARNEFTGDESDFNASPAVADGQMFLRSNENLYCIASPPR